MTRVEIPNQFSKPIKSGESLEVYKEIYRFDPEKMWEIAETMVNFSLDVKEDDKLVIVYNPGARQLTKMVGFLASEKGAVVSTRAFDEEVVASILAGAKKHGLSQGYFEDMSVPRWTEIGWADKYAAILSFDSPNAHDETDKQTKSLFNKAFSPVVQLRSNRKRWTAIILPTPQEAKIDNEEFSNYVKIFLEACSRDWKAVEEAQDTLIDILRGGKTLELYADSSNPDKNLRTRLKMDIEGMIFANETVLLNIPGSEVFASPNMGTIEGQFATPYPVMFSGKTLPNIRFVFEKGKVVEHFTDGDMEWLEGLLDSDEGSREVGEVAFGTNPVFKRPYLNPLFVEKVGGSFHIAIGNSYSYTECAGRKVKIDNGVRSSLHEDLTRMMLPEFGGGKVILDGKTIQKNGRFLDPRLSILNQ